VAQKLGFAVDHWPQNSIGKFGLADDLGRSQRDELRLLPIGKAENGLKGPRSLSCANVCRRRNGIAGVLHEVSPAGP